MKSNITILVLAILYASCLTFLFPIDDTIIDRANYLAYAENSLLLIGNYLNQGLLSLFFNEPIWLLINIFLSLLTSPETTLQIIIFFSSFTVSYLVLKNSPKYFWILLIILIFPNVIKNFIIHIRQGLAVAFFLIGWFSLSKPKRYLFILMSPFIHSSFFIIITIFFLTSILQKMRFAFDLRLIIYILLGLTVSFGLGFIASFLGMRQANEYEFTAASSSGLGFLFWFIILSLYVTSGKAFLQKHSFVIGMIVFYLITYFFIEVTARIFESAIILVLLASLELKLKQIYIVFSMIIFYTILSYILRVNQSFLGFGV